MIGLAHTQGPPIVLVYPKKGLCGKYHESVIVDDSCCIKMCYVHPDRRQLLMIQSIRRFRIELDQLLIAIERSNHGYCRH